METNKNQTGIRFEPELLYKITYAARDNKRSLNAHWNIWPSSVSGNTKPPTAPSRLMRNRCTKNKTKACTASAVQACFHSYFTG